MVAYDRREWWQRECSIVKRKNRRARWGLLRSWMVIWENWEGLKPEGKSMRRWVHRDLDRWCLRMETAVMTAVSSSADGGEEAEEQMLRDLLGDKNTVRLDTV